MQKTQTICLILLATIATGFSLYYLKTVLLPFVIALFIVIGCRPILEFVQVKLRLHRFFAFVVTFLLGVVLLAAFGLLTWFSVNDMAQNSEVYHDRLSAIATWVMDYTRGGEEEGDVDSEATSTSDEVGTEQKGDADDTMAETSSTVPAVNDAPIDQDIDLALDEFFNFARSYARTQTLSLASSLSSMLSYGVLILIFVFFLLLENSQSGSAIGHNRLATGIAGEIETQIRKYLIMKTGISILTGFAFGLVLWLFGVPLAIVFGFLAFLLNYIPNIGPMISTLLPVPFLVLNSEMSPTAAIVCFILIATTQFVSGNVVEPKIMGKSFDVSPVFLLLALMFFGLIWGIIGMFLATQIVSIIRIVLQQSSGGKPVAELMAGRWGPSDSAID